MVPLHSYKFDLFSKNDFKTFLTLPSNQVNYSFLYASLYFCYVHFNVLKNVYGKKRIESI